MIRSNLLRAVAGLVLATAGLTLTASTAGAQGTPTVEGSWGLVLSTPHIHVSRWGSTSLLSVVGSSPLSVPTWTAVQLETAPGVRERCSNAPSITCEARGLRPGVSYLYRLRLVYSPTEITPWSPWTREVHGRLNPLEVRGIAKPLDVVIGERYYHRLRVVSGGVAPYTYYALVGSLPDGLRLARNGAIVGTPLSDAAVADPLISVTDRLGRSTTFHLKFTVSSSGPGSGTTTTTTPSTTTTTPVVVPSGGGGGGSHIQPLEVGSLPPATATGNYNVPLAISGGTGPYTCSATGLPPTLTLDPTTCQLSGTVPTSPGTYDIVITVTDATGDTITSTLAITVVSVPALTPSALPTAIIGADYEADLVATGGAAPYSWSITSGALPAGLTLDPSTGVISGTPGSDAVDSSATIQVTDANGVTASATYSVPVDLNDLSWVRGSQSLICLSPGYDTGICDLPNATQGGKYAVYLNVFGGTGTGYSFQISGGALPAGLTLSPTGVIGGTVSPSAPTGTYQPIVTVTDSSGDSLTETFPLYVAAPPAIYTSTLPDAGPGTPYSATVAANTAAAPLVWTASGLPSGLSIESNPPSGGFSDGVITGTTAQTGTFSVTLTATDDNGVASQITLPLTVTATPTVYAPDGVPSATQGVAYSTTLTAGGGTTPYSWSVTSGELPDGLALDPSTGQISGTPSNSATSETFTVTVSSPDGDSSSTQLTILVYAPPAITTTSLADATQTGSYDQTLASTGGAPPVSWSVTSGELPDGLSLNASTGEIAGTVSASATSETFTLTATDSNGATASQQLSITVNPPPTVTTSSLPNATQGVAYSTTLAASGGTAPLAWLLVGGSLPSGLTLNTSTGTISGTVSGSATAGNYSITVQVTDANGAVSQATLALVVATS